MKLSKKTNYSKRYIDQTIVSPSVRQMLQCGLIKKVSSGIYTYMPAGYKMLLNLMEVVRKNLDHIDFEELHFPALVPTTLLGPQRSAALKDVLFKSKDYKGKEYYLAPTHEEVAVNVIKEFISLESCPIKIFQIQTKYRDELRPKGGLLRCKEFLMKDGYSFHSDYACLEQTYNDMVSAYLNIFKELGIPIAVAQSDPGSMGGKINHEFHLLTSEGEDTLVMTEDKSYVANLEIATYQCDPKVTRQESLRVSNYIYQNHLGEKYTLLLDINSLINLNAVANLLGKGEVISTNDDTWQLYPIYIDESCVHISSNLMTHHDHKTYDLNHHVLKGAKINQLRYVKNGDLSIDGKPLQLHKGLELGHTFQLLDYYTTSEGISIGPDTPVLMGCYGIGMSRLLAACVIVGLDQGSEQFKLSSLVSGYKGIIISKMTVESQNIANAIYKKKSHYVLDDRTDDLRSKIKEAYIQGYENIIIVSNTDQIEFIDRINNVTSIMNLDQVLRI